MAAVQLAGSAAAAMVSWSVPAGWVNRSLVALLAVPGFVGAVWLWRGETRGYRVSRWVQAAQLLRLKTATLTYLVTVGPMLVVGVQDGDLALTSGLGAGVYLAHTPVTPAFVGVNLVALLTLAVIWRADAPAPPREAGAGKVVAA